MPWIWRSITPALQLPVSFVPVSGYSGPAISVVCSQEWKWKTEKRGSRVSGRSWGMFAPTFPHADQAALSSSLCLSRRLSLRYLHPRKARRSRRKSKRQGRHGSAGEREEERCDVWRRRKRARTRQGGKGSADTSETTRTVGVGRRRLRERRLLSSSSSQ